MAKRNVSWAVADKTIVQAARQFEASKAAIDEARIEHAQLNKALEKKGVHRQALKLVTRLLGMEVTKAADYVESFRRYSAVLGLDQRLLGNEAEFAEVASEAPQPPEETKAYPEVA